MNVLVTGGSGFIGINIADVLAEEKDNLIVLYSRNPPPSPAMEALRLLPGKTVWEKGDVLDEERITAILKKYDIDHIAHGAVITPNPEREKEQIQKIVQVNCTGTLNVLSAARKHGIRRFVYISSIAVYGTACQETDPVYVETEKNPTNTYEVTKYATELLCQRYANLYSMDVAAIRLGDVYGAWEYRSGVRDTMSAPCQAAFCALTGQTAKMKKDGATGWIYGRDAASAVVAMLKADRLTQFSYNCGGAERWSIPQFCEYLKQEYKNFDFLVDMNEKDPNITFFSEKDNGIFDMEQLKKDTGFTPAYGLEQGSHEYITWLKKYSEMVVSMPKR